MNAGFYNPQHMNKRTLAQYTVKMFLTKASMATVLITIATRWYHPVSLPDCTWVPPGKVGVVNCLLSLKYARTAHIVHVTFQCANNLQAMQTLIR